MTGSPSDPFPVQWAELTDPELRTLAARDPVAVLPMGAVEQHGPHLPVSTDTLLAQGILDRALTELPGDAPVVVLPTQVLGTSEEHGSFSGTGLCRHHWRPGAVRPYSNIVTQALGGLQR